MAQEFQRLREVAAEEITAEREKCANLEANQRPILPSLHEEIMHLRQEVHAQHSELRVTRSELHAASARSSEWEHAGNSVGFSSTHVSHTPVTIVSPVGSNSRNGSNVGTPEKHVEAPTPPAPQGPPVTYGPEHTATSSAGKSSFRDFANDLFGESSKEMISWGGPMYTLEQSSPVLTSNYQGRSATLSAVDTSQYPVQLDPPPGLVTNASQSSSSNSRSGREPGERSQHYLALMRELLKQQQGDANGAPNLTSGSGTTPPRDDSVPLAETTGHAGGKTNESQNKAGGSRDDENEDVRQLIAELTRARKSEERVRKERNDWKSWAETFESELEESRKEKKKPPGDGGADGDGGGGNGNGNGGPGDRDDITNPGGWRPGGGDPDGGGPPGDGSDAGDAAMDKPKISRREADKLSSQSPQSGRLESCHDVCRPASRRLGSMATRSLQAISPY